MRTGWLLVLAACWHAPAHAPVAPVFEGIALERSTCSKGSVLVPVELDGVRGKFIVDSGAFTNVVYEAFAKRAKLQLEDNADRVGGGRGLRVFNVVPRSFAIPGIPHIVPPPFVMLEHHASPLARDGCGIAGVISPATLLADGLAVIVDLGAARMTRVADTAIDAHLDRVGGRRFLATTSSHEYTPGIDVAFGERTIRMMIDTGACCTWVTTTSRIGRTHLPRSVAGGKIDRLLGTTTSRVARTDLRFDDVARTLDLKLLEPDDGDAREAGAIGADALANCVVAIGRSEIRGTCR